MPVRVGAALLPPSEQAASERVSAIAAMRASPIVGIFDTLRVFFIEKLLCGVDTARGLFPPSVLSAQAENNKKM
jgi:hypothetical protein